ncbi:MAG: type I DNA topoisomerase [Bacteroidales bacterium]|nr:type I DNA topoisomerase [Bacteroidales bacterium]
MADNLVIVESPAKAGTIQKFLGQGFTVKPSFGHIRDLQDNKLSVDIRNGFAPEYVVPADKRKVVADLRKLAEKSDIVWLASDEDREGEAISWHLAETLGLPAAKTRRIVFHEITKHAILEAVEHPRNIDMNMVAAQQARRVLDRLVGFELSPVLWRKIQPKLSAGRVQSVALRLVVDREKEIMAFGEESFYRVEAVFHPEGTPAATKVTAVLDHRFVSMEEAEDFLRESIGAKYTLTSVEKKEGTRFPAAPFTTSTLQQEASRRLRFPVSVTMRIAQQLYEKGLITYMRTDSTNLSSLAINSAKQLICDNFGEEYSHPRQYKTHSKGAQEAHEAIRPTYIANPSIEGTAQEKKLYDLIWKRTVASQMADARVLGTTLTITSDRGAVYSAQATEILFDGFLKLYSESSEDGTAAGSVVLPSLNTGCAMTDKQITAACKFTQAPPRYSEATLVKKLEELGIGRPSTYAPTISTLTTARGYLVKGDKEGRKVTVTNLTLKGDTITSSHKTETVGADKGKLLPQEIGIIVSDYLVAHFPGIVDYDFTARVEKDFDEIAEGGKRWNEVIADFYKPFHATVEDTVKEGGKSRVSRFLGNDPETGLPVTARFGQYGPYVQKGDEDSRQFASLEKGQLIETITLEEALALFSLPRTLGEINGIPVVVTKGRFGPYIKYGTTNVSLPKGKDPLTFTLDEAAPLLSGSTPAGSVISDFGDILILKGKYGPYIKAGGVNYRIPRGKKAESLTEQDCRAIISDNKK